jgi:CRISPR-associated protein Cas5d
MAYGVRLKVWGDYACFTRPEMKVERVSYDVMTPSAARGILEAIYWKPAIVWAIDRIHVLNPIRFENIRRNEVAGKIPIRNIAAAMKDGASPVETFIEESRQQRATMVLCNVSYVIEAHFVFTGSEDNNAAKHKEMFDRRVAKGQCFHNPYLGCREFPAYFESVAGEIPRSALEGERDLGWMLHDMDFAAESSESSEGDEGKPRRGRKKQETGNRRDIKPHFFCAVMHDGIVEIPPWNGKGVRS